MSKLTFSGRSLIWGGVTVLLVAILSMVIVTQIVAHGGDAGSIHVCRNINNDLMVLRDNANDDCSSLPEEWRNPVDWQIQGTSSDLTLPFAGSSAGGGTALSITQTGTGIAGFFDIVNSSSGFPSLFARTHGTGIGGSFIITNASSSAAAVQAQTNGSGAAVRGTNVGTGRAGFFETFGTESSKPVLEARASGTGPAGKFLIENTRSQASAIIGDNRGSGAAVSGVANGNGMAGSFVVSQSISGSPALNAETNGSGPAVNGISTGSGPAGQFIIANSGNSNPALNVQTSGTGPAMVAFGNVGIGTATPGAPLHVNGPDNNGTTATLKIASGDQSMLFDGNEIDAINSALYLNNNRLGHVIIANGGGRVGIGTSNPTADLHVIGDIKLTGDVILPTTTRWLSLTPMAFTHNNMLVNLLGPDLNFSRTTTTLHGNNQSPTWQFSAPVSLPHGATITQVRARITDTNNDVNLNVKLRSVSLLNEAVTNHANFSSSGSAGEARTFTDSSISSPVVDNENLAYSVDHPLVISDPHGVHP